jgi:hypothetical protein
MVTVKILSRKSRINGHPIQKMSHQISVRVVSGHIPSMDTELDNISARSDHLSLRFWKDMPTLMRLVQENNDQGNGSGALLQAMQD